MDRLLSKIILASGTSLVVTENVQLQPLWTALITLAISIVTVLSVEGVAWLKAWLQKKRAKEEAEEKKYEEADEIVKISEAEEKSKKEE